MNELLQRSIKNHVVVVAIQHDSCRVWLLHSEVPDPIDEIRRPDSELMHVRGGQERHLHHTEANEEPYFSLIRSEIAAASQVILFGHGKGNSNLKERFEKYLDEHDRSLRQRCVNGGNVDFAALTNEQLVALAKSVWARQ